MKWEAGSFLKRIFYENMEQKKKSYQDIEERTFDFAVRVIKMTNQLSNCVTSFLFKKQIISSATSINSNIVHARAGVSRPDFVNHMKIARKESKETKRWLQMIVASELANPQRMSSLLEESDEIIKIIVTIIKNAEKNKK